VHFTASIVKMGFTKKAFLAAVCIASTAAYDIVVQSTGGNVTGKFGHPYGYGFLHEVNSQLIAKITR
jgi:hypothetical protein